jgi:cyclophilin family peptidyl-prolyl cis-trans isomerase
MNKITKILTCSLFTIGMMSYSVAKNIVNNECKNPLVLMQTNMGNIQLQLDSKDSPITVKNFLHYVNEGYYTNKIYYRVIPGFVIQAGEFNQYLQSTPADRKPIKNEADNGLSNLKYTISMARYQEPNSADVTFFINLEDNPQLDFKAKTPESYGYAVFGHVTQGTDVVDAMGHVATTDTNPDFADLPINPIIINSVSVQSCQN